MLGADLDEPSPSPALAFPGDADMVYMENEEAPYRRGGLGWTGNEADKLWTAFMSGVEPFMSLVNLASTQRKIRGWHVFAHGNCH